MSRRFPESRRPITVFVVMEHDGSIVAFLCTSSLHSDPVYTENADIYPVSCSDTMNSLIWNLFGLDLLYWINFTLPQKAHVLSSIATSAEGMYTCLNLY